MARKLPGRVGKSNLIEAMFHLERVKKGVWAGDTGVRQGVGVYLHAARS
jgi:hypothetical protein